MLIYHCIKAGIWENKQMNKGLFHICTYALLHQFCAGRDCKLGQVYILSPKNLQASWKSLSFFIA